MMHPRKKVIPVEKVEVELPPAYCDDDGKTSHHYTQLAVEIWRCSKCWAVKWQPSTISDAEKISYSVRSKGARRAYEKAIVRRPAIHRLLVKLNDMKRVKKFLSKKEFRAYLIDMANDRDFKKLQT